MGGAAPHQNHETIDIHDDSDDDDNVQIMIAVPPPVVAPSQGVIELVDSDDDECVVVETPAKRQRVV